MRLSFFLLGLLFMTLETQAQQAPAVTDALKLTDSLYLPEKMHLHLDRSQYAPGETLWFKAYLMQAGLPAGISKTLYVNVSDEAGKVLIHHTSPIVQGTSSGSYVIPLNFKGQRLLLTAYTTWMLNDDSAFLYRQWIPVAQSGSPANAAPAPTRFYLLPEGGGLVQGVSSRVAFLAHDGSGRPVNVSGVVKDNNGRVVADSVRTRFNGMGSFGLRPQAGSSYQFVGKDEAGKPITQALPAAAAQGVTLNVNGTAEYRQFLVQRSEGLAPGGKYQVLATMNGEPVYKANADLSNRLSTSGQIPVASLPSGVLTITLFDAALNPVAERISFVHNDNFSIDAQLATVDMNIKPRGRNVVEMVYYDSLPATYSIAVTDADLPQATNPGSIASRLLLSSELQGRVWNPTWYFTTYTEEAKDNLDLVMLTHGWRKINWAQARTGRAPQLKFYPDTAYLRLSGMLNGGNSADYRAAREMTAIVQLADSSRQLMVLPVNSGGQVRLEDQILFDTARIYYMFGKNQLLTQKLNLQMSNGLLPAPANLRYVDLYRGFADTLGRRRLQYFAAEQDKLRRLLETTTLEGVTVQSKKKSNLQVLDEKYANGLFSGGDAYNFDVANDPRAAGALTVLQYLQGQVAGLQISGGGVGGDGSVSWRGGTPDFFMDQMPVDLQMLSSIPMSDVAYIKVFRPPFFGGMGGGGGGGIAVYTKRGGDRSPATDRAPSGMNKSLAVGYTAQRTFFSPDYSKDAPLGSDVRPTIYWNPYVVADGKQRKTRITFYNNDISRRLRIVVEGMNANGQLLRVEKVVP